MNGYYGRGSYTGTITYSDANYGQVRGLVDVSGSCSYDLTIHCYGVHFPSNNYWVSYQDAEIEWDGSDGSFCGNPGNINGK